MSFEEAISNKQLRHARHERGWTQAELAEKVGTTFETVSRWERGIKVPSAYYRRKLCDVFGKTAEELGLFADSSTLLTPGSSPCVFFSSAYADAEHRFVTSLKTELQARDVTVWSSRAIKRQEVSNKRNLLQEAIRAVQVVLLIVSPTTSASHHVQDTLRIARHYKRPVCVVWINGESLQECLPAGYDEPYAVIDAREGDEQLLRDKIMATLEQTWLASSTSGGAEPIWKVPIKLLPLIGREEELTKLGEVLSGQQVRLITLLGTGGIGKTHLGLQVAMDMREHFADGICFVPLAAISDHRLVIPAIAKKLGMREAGEGSLLDKVKVALQKRRLLLLIDNFEQVLKASPQLSELLADCVYLKILVTSRARLHVHDEYVFPVPPLTLPALSQPLEIDALAQNASVALFLQRAQAARPDFQITLTNARAIAEICVKLDGLPLAIELAAARIRSLASQGLLARLEEHLLDVVISKEQDVTDRQRTLRNTIAWSYNLLDAEEQQLFRRLCVFAGGRTVEAVEALYKALGDSALHVWDGMESLLDKSLLRVAEQQREGRLLLLAMIREYGLECLEASGEAESIRQAHAEYYLTLAEEGEAHLKSTQQGIWLAKLDQEQENLRTALRWFIEHGEVEPALRLCGALWWFWRLRGYWSEGRGWLEAVLGLPQVGERTVARAKALYAAGDFAYCQDDYLIARSFLEESVTLCRTLGVERELATALGMFGILMRVQGELAAAVPLLEESEKLCRRLNNKWELAYLLRRLAEHAAQAGDLKWAVERAQESLMLAQKLGDKSLLATVLSTLGSIAARQGNLTQAIAYNQESLILARELGDKLLIALALNNLGYFTALKGDLTLVKYVHEGFALMREVGDRMYITKTFQSVGYVTLRQGNLAQAREWFFEGLFLAQEIGSETDIGFNLFGLALTALAEGQSLQAAYLLGAVESRLNVDVDLNPDEFAEYKRAVVRVRTRLGEKTFAAALSEGRTMTVEQLVVASRASTTGTPLPSPKYPDGLTEREVQVLCLVTKGLTDEQIAEQLVIAPRTVNTHLTSIYRKIQVSSVGKERKIAPRMAAARYATEHDLC